MYDLDIKILPPQKKPGAFDTRPHASELAIGSLTWARRLTVPVEFFRTHESMPQDCRRDPAQADEGIFIGSSRGAPSGDGKEGAAAEGKMMRGTSNPPSIRIRAFDCPYCRAFTSQYWYQIRAHSLDEKTPNVPNIEHREMIAKKAVVDPTEGLKKVLNWVDTMLGGSIFLGDKWENESTRTAYNIFLSRCHHCNKFAVWVHEQLIYPTPMSGPPPNSDLPAEVLRDYEEAGRIVGQSPRGAAALLRLAIEKLCKFLGEDGKNINDDIARLVKKGLSPVVQRSLDAVRVIGNEAVHPGKLDLKDDTDAAISLFQLVNIIAQQMISNPKHADEVYATLPESKRKEIEKRDAKP